MGIRYIDSPEPTLSSGVKYVESKSVPESSYIEKLAAAGGQSISDRGIGFIQAAQDAGVPMHKIFSAIVGRDITPEEFDIATQNAVKANTEASKDSGIGGAIVSGIADPLNLAPFAKAGKMALPLYGAVSGATRGEQNNSDLLSRAESSAAESLITTLAGKIVEKIGGKIANKFVGKSPVSQEAANTLLAENPDIKTYTGEELKSALSSAEGAARKAKETAYAVAEPYAEKLKINVAKIKHGGMGEIPEQIPSAKNIFTDLGDSVRATIDKFDPDVVKNRGAIEKIVGDFEKQASSGPVSWKYIDSIRKRLFALPKANDAEAKIRAEALSSFHDYADNLLNRGIIEGDQNAIKLVRDANSKNAYWRKNFTGNDANKVISDFIESRGGINEIAPENLLDKFINVGDAGYKNTTALQSVLGDKAKPILQHGFYNKLRMQSLDGQNIDPSKLSKSITTFLSKNKTLANSVFNESEISSLKRMAATADRYAKTGEYPSGVLSKISYKIPIFGPLLEQALKTRGQKIMMDELANPLARNISTPSAKFNYVNFMNQAANQGGQ